LAEVCRPALWSQAGIIHGDQHDFTRLVFDGAHGMNRAVVSKTEDKTAGTARIVRVFLDDLGGRERRLEFVHRDAIGLAFALGV